MSVSDPPGGECVRSGQGVGFGFFCVGGGEAWCLVLGVVLL